MWSPVECGADAAPCARGKHSATLLGGHVYVLGGRGAGGAVPLKDFWRYTIATGAWERLQCRGSPPPALQEHSATAHDSRLYVFGGEATALSSETPLWILDTETQFWRKLPGHTGCSGTVRRRSARPAGPGGPAPGGPSGRRGHSAHALKDCLLIYGGYKDLRGSTNELWAFHYESESWQQVRTARGGPARHRHAAALHDARLYVHAGQCDLRACSDLWTYDTISRVWSAVRVSRGVGGAAGPGPRAGHAAARAGAHLYVFGGDAGDQHASNDMWRFHFATETWERITPSTKWPAARVDACALLIPRAPPRALGGRSPAAEAPPRAPPTLLSRLSSFNMRRSPRCAYSVLGERDSTESIPRDSPSMNKSRSAHHLARRQPADGAAAELPREPISVPDFADMVLPTPVLSPAQACKLVYLDSDEEREHEHDADFSTSDYASAERVNRLSGFSNPHYLGPDVRTLGMALTPDSGLGPGDIELQDMSALRARRPHAPRAPRPAPRDDSLHLLLVGGREPPHVARLQAPLSMWTYRLL